MADLATAVVAQLELSDGDIVRPLWLHCGSDVMLGVENRGASMMYVLRFDGTEALFQLADLDAAIDLFLGISHWRVSHGPGFTIELEGSELASARIVDSGGGDVELEFAAKGSVHHTLRRMMNVVRKTRR